VKHLLRIITLFLTLAILLSFVSAFDVIYSWHDNKKEIALTFDDGPHPRYTPEILEILREYGIKATFFVIGQNIEWYDGIIQMEFDEGHEIGNHTYSHLNLKTLPYSEVCAEIEEAEALIGEKIECRPRLLRPPGGMLGDDLVRAARDENYTLVCWSIDTLDWAHTSAEKMALNVISNVSGGDIILMHDYTSGGAHTVEALEIIIPKLKEMGYEFVTVSELICEE
jgi:peptidoglycan/xylan/chitin deacetylase (PgdA/CDA1 family)